MSSALYPACVLSPDRTAGATREAKASCKPGGGALGASVQNAVLL